MFRTLPMFFICLQLLLLTCACSIVSARDGCSSMERVSPCENVYCKESEGVVTLKLRCENIETSFSFAEFLKFRGSGDSINVKSLRIIRSHITDFTDDMFEHIALRDVSVSQTNITSLSKHTFRGASLEYLSLAYCNLNPKSIENIRHIQKLKSLHLTDDNIERVKLSWFHDPRYSIKLKDTLVTLTLKNNRISSIEDRAFSELNTLEFLDLSQNKIKTLKRNFFPGGLYALSLAYNNIEELPEDLFKEMDDIRFVRLEHNYIKKMKEEVFDYIFNLGELDMLDIRGNPIECDCHLQWLPQITRYLGRRLGRFYGECNTPERLKKKPIKGITLEDFHCVQQTKVLP